MGANHARVCAEIGVLCGVCDYDIDAVEGAAERFGVPGYSDLDKAISETNPVGAIIATPTSTHLEVAKKLISQGVNILVEKPIAIDLESAREMIELAEEANLVLSVGHIERYNPVIMEAKKILERGDWGGVVTISSRRVSNLPGRIRDVGVILDLGIHDIDNSIFLMGSEPMAVFAIGGRLNEIDYEDHATIFIRFQNGNGAVVEVNWITPMKVRKLSLTCENNFVEVDYMKQIIKTSNSTFQDTQESGDFPAKIEFIEREIPVKFKEPLRSEIENFLDAIEGKIPSPQVDGAQGLMALKVALAAMESLSSGKVVEIGD